MHPTHVTVDKKWRCFFWIYDLIICDWLQLFWLDWIATVGWNRTKNAILGFLKFFWMEVLQHKFEFPWSCSTKFFWAGSVKFLYSNSLSNAITWAENWNPCTSEEFLRWCIILLYLEQHCTKNNIKNRVAQGWYKTF